INCPQKFLPKRYTLSHCRKKIRRLQAKSNRRILSLISARQIGFVKDTKKPYPIKADKAF
ncbi:MAG: hypothetical protein ACI4MC_06745, partial [Candidatus Coproplasma sp.]